MDVDSPGDESRRRRLRAPGVDDGSPRRRENATPIGQDRMNEGGSGTADGAAMSTSGRQAPDVKTTQASRQQHAQATEQRGMAANVIGELFALWLSAFTGEWIAWERA